MAPLPALDFLHRQKMAEMQIYHRFCFERKHNSNKNLIRIRSRFQPKNSLGHRKVKNETERKLSKYQPALAPPVAHSSPSAASPVIMNYLAPHLSTDLAHTHAARLRCLLFNQFWAGRKLGVSIRTVIFCLHDCMAPTEK